VFFEESPDPLPDCSVSGYPICIQFNENKIDKNSFQLVDFKLYDSENNEINSLLLTSSNDPNEHFSDFEFALMPLERLNWGEEYSVKVVYEENGETYNINWSFITRMPGYPYITVKENDATVNIQSNKEYAVYLKPSDCNDTFSGYQYSYQSNIQDINIAFIDSNTIYIRATGPLGSKIIVDFSNNKKVTFQISTSDSAINTLKLKKEENVEMTILSGWNLLGLPIDTGNPINVSEVFNKEEINTLWKWSNNKWQIWSPNTAIKEILAEYSIPEINSVIAGEGF
jgi:hypothetical protein